MTQEEVLTTEEETLNWNSEIDSVDDVTTEEETESKTYTQEEVQEMVENEKKKFFDKDPWVQNLLKEKKTLEKMFDEIAKVWADNKYLVELYESDSKVAEKILDKYFNGMSIDEYKADIWYTQDLQNPEQLKKIAKAEAEKLFIRDKIDEWMESFIKELKMEEQEEKDFRKELEDLIERKKLNKEDTKNLRPLFTKAYKLSTDNDETLAKLRKSENVANKMATTWGKNTWGNIKIDPIQKEADDFVSKYLFWWK